MNLQMRKKSKPRNDKRSKSETSSDSEDRISKFPDEILITIISHLPIQEATRTSTLSRRWRNLWTFTTNLDLGSVDQVRDLETRLGPNKFQNCLNKIFESLKSPSLNRLRICLNAFNVQSGSDFARWVDFAIRKCVHEFDLEIVSSKRGQYPYPFLCISNFDSLKSLSLQYENINAKHIESFLSSCPSLERLCLAKSAILLGLKISGSSLKLKYLEICCCFNLNWVKISAPNLVSFKYWGPEIALALDNVPLLSEVSFLEAYCISLVKHRFKHFTCILSQLRSLSLTLNYPWLTEFPKLDGLRNLHTLELNLGVWDFDNPFQLCTSITTALPFLHKFSLRLYWFMNYESMDTWVPIIENDRHHCLKVVDFVGFVGCSLDVGIVRYLVENAVSLEKITIRPCRESWRNSHGDLMEVKEKEEARGRAHEFRAILSRHTQLLVL